MTGSNRRGPKRRGTAQAPVANPAAPEQAQAPVPTTADAQKDWTVLLLALTMLLAPAMGVPSEEMLQDTLKSMVVSFGALAACLTYLWHQRHRDSQVFWHPLLFLPLLLCFHALASILWSHAFLGSVEAIRWFVFSLLLWLGMNTVTPERMPRLAWGIHIGATVAALWTALQFWIDFKFFPQGPNPASTFVNRNFFAEFAVSALPFCLFLLTREKSNGKIAVLAISLALNLTALMMTGSRAAQLALLLLVPVMAVILHVLGGTLAVAQWSMCKRLAVPALVLVATLGLGAIPTGNAQLIQEYGGGNALDRAFTRAASMTASTEYTQGSFSIRAVMWRATGRMIAARPLTGVGAGAWEVQAPRYQEPGSQLETDFYAHNEILQLLAEYGLIGWIFLLGLLSYLGIAALRTLTGKTEDARREAPLRAFTLASLGAFLLVSNAGFPWRLATTGALFALSLSVLAASDLRLYRARLKVVPCSQRTTRYALWATALLMLLALYIAQQAAVAERKLVRAVQIALTISKSGRPNDPAWNPAKNEMLALLKDGIAINPHYRKITPMAADEMASWGDWEDAVWVWESVLASRPYIVAVAANISRGYLQMGDYKKSIDYLEQATRLQPTAPAVRSLQVVLLYRIGRYAEAAQIIRQLFAANQVDYDLVYTAYLVGVRLKDWPLAIQALELRLQRWPSEARDGWLKLGDIYRQPDIRDDAKALAAFRAALQATPDAQRADLLQKMPAPYREQLQGTP